MSEHALLSASSAHRWLHCTPSARLEEQYPDTTSEYAEEGTLAHEIAALKLSKYFAPMGPRAYTTKLNKLKKHSLYQEEMQKCTDVYLDKIKEITNALPTTPYVAVEKRVSYDAYAPGGFGTADCIIMYGNTLWIIDYKHGKGVPVDAVNNDQLTLYALGALQEYGFIYNISNVVMIIIQPRLDNISEWRAPADELMTYGNAFIRPRAELAYKGEGEYNPSDKACRFCRAKAQCRARATKNLDLLRLDMRAPALMSNDEIGAVLKQGQDLAAWIKDVQEYALSQVLTGNNIAGWKAVEGRSIRQFTDIDTAFEVLINNGIDPAMLYERKPVTLTAAEKIVGKMQFNTLLSDYIQKTKGKPTLVPETDSRAPYSTATDDFKEVI